MNTMIVIASLVVLTLSAASSVVLIRTEARRRRREREISKVLDRANAALAAELERPRMAGMTEVDPTSPLGQAIIRAFGLDEPCGCPNCEESRRIAHAEQQKRDGQ